MKKGTLLFALLVLVALSFVFSGEKTDVKAIIHPIESTIYSDMDALYALSGMARPSTNRPWSDAEARMILSRVDREGLSDIAAELYDRIEAELDKGLRWQFGDDFQLSTGIDFAMEMYAHSNSDASLQRMTGSAATASARA